MAGFERSRIGRLVLSIGIMLLLVAEIGVHLPAGPLARAVTPASSRALQLAASEQTWEVFAPNPRGVSLRLDAQVTFADGSTSQWDMPDGPVVGTNLRFYRWRKWLESARADAEWLLWEPTARWVATLYADGASPVTKVELIRYFHDNVPVDPQPPWRSFTYYTLDLDPDGTAS